MKKIENAKTCLDEFKKNFFNRVQIHENEYKSFNTIEIKILTDMFDNMLSGLIELEKKIDQKK